MASNPGFELPLYPYPPVQSFHTDSTPGPPIQSYHDGSAPHSVHQFDNNNILHFLNATPPDEPYPANINRWPSPYHAQHPPNVSEPAYISILCGGRRSPTNPGNVPSLTVNQQCPLDPGTVSGFIGDDFHSLLSRTSIDALENSNRLLYRPIANPDLCFRTDFVQLQSNDNLYQDYEASLQLPNGLQCRPAMPIQCSPAASIRNELGTSADGPYDRHSALLFQSSPAALFESRISPSAAVFIPELVDLSEHLCAGEMGDVLQHPHAPQ